MLWYVVTASFGIVSIAWLFMPDPTPRCGVYVQPNKWYPIKYAIFRVILWLRRQRNRSLQQQTTARTGKDAGYGIRSRSTPEEMDRVQNLPKEYPLAVDAVYFNGGDAQGNFLVAATARRHENLVNTILLLRFPDLGLLELPSIPDTSLYTSEPGAFSVGGLTLEPLAPMKKWRLSFKGPMRLRNEKREVMVQFTLDWDSFTPFFDFDTDMHPATMADAIARHHWTKDYFDNLKRVHQTHYEQFGVISGDINIEGYGSRHVNLRGVRDHSYGNVRDWSLLHRYSLQYASLEDGSAVCVGAISMPSVLTRLTVGYVFHPDGKMDSVSSSTFELFEVGEDGRPPKDLAFSFTAGGKQYDLTCSVLDSPIFYMGVDWDAKIHERFCRYDINGVKGWGISEWDYKNYVGKEAEQQWYTTYHQ